MLWRFTLFMVLWLTVWALAVPPSAREGLMMNPDPIYCYGDRRYDALRDEEPDCAPDVVREAKDDGYWVRTKRS